MSATYWRRIEGAVPGLVLCAVVSVVGYGIDRLETALFGRAYLDALVLAIIIGMLVRSIRPPAARFAPGIALAAKLLLEIAVMLLGASLSLQLLMSVGLGLVLGIFVVVALSLAASYLVARLLGLPWRMGILIACGNSICGNSAIAAVAPVIGASSADVAASITFTAVLGVIIVLALPLLVPLIGLNETQYGVIAGLTVYAVPQVLAATAPVGPLSLQIGTFVKLVRVLCLGPIVVALTLVAPGREGAARPSIGRLVPWFIIGFLAMMVARSIGLIPTILLEPISLVTKVLTVLAMAALGLGVDVAVVARAGGRVTIAVTMSILVLACLSVIIVKLGLVGSG